MWFKQTFAQKISDVILQHGEKQRSENSNKKSKNHYTK